MFRACLQLILSALQVFPVSDVPQSRAGSHPSLCQGKQSNAVSCQAAELISTHCSISAWEIKVPSSCSRHGFCSQKRLAPDLPLGWGGHQHHCQASHPFLIFNDFHAVKSAGSGAAALCQLGYQDSCRWAFGSCFPRRVSGEPSIRGAHPSHKHRWQGCRWWL